MGLFGRKVERARYGAGKHKLGFSCGHMIETKDGRAIYVPPVGESGTFTVAIADVRGFAASPGEKALQSRLKVLGDGVELVEVLIPFVSLEPVQEWFRGHPSFVG